MGYREAFALPKEEVLHAVPPGTSKLIDHVFERTATGTVTDQHGELNLVPCPSSDPADPLNWSYTRKAGILFIISMFPFVGNYAAAVLGPTLPFLVMAFDTPETLSKLTRLIAVNVLMGGVSSIWWVPLANAYGRRPVVLFSLLMLTTCSVWCAVAKSYNSLLIARIFQGIGIGPSDTVCPDIVGEIFFLHQRGRAMAIYTLFLALGSSAGGLSGSYIATNLGWRWAFWIAVILSAANLAFAFVLLPETLFNREAALARLERPTSSSGQSVEAKDVQVEERETVVHEPYTFSRSLSIGVNRGGLGIKFLSPWLSLRFPGVWVVVLLYSGLVGGIVTISVRRQLQRRTPSDELRKAADV